MEKLDPHSKAVADKLFAEFPEWLSFAQSKPSKYGRGYYLYVEIPAPEGSRAGALQIWTDNGDVNVAFRDLPVVSSMADEPGFPELIDLVMQILKDECSFAICTFGDEWKWTLRLEAGEPIPSADENSSFLVVSWSGVFDREI